MTTPAITEVEQAARDDRTVSEVVNSAVPEHSGYWSNPDRQVHLRRVLTDRRLAAKRLVGSDGYLGLSLVFPPEDSDIAARLEQAVSSDHELVVVAGPTYGGKTTTLTAIARHLTSTGRRVGNIEDTYEVLGRSNINTFVFSDPDPDELFPSSNSDVVVAGEICTTEAAIEALRASRRNTVLATMHGQSAIKIPEHLVGLATLGAPVPESIWHPDELVDPSRFVRPATLGILGFRPPETVPPIRLTVVCQRLVRRLCVSCSSDGEPRGCGECQHGYCGFAALAETVEFEAQSIADLSTQDLSTHETYRPFDEHAAALVANGVTTQAEIRRVLGHSR